MLWYSVSTVLLPYSDFPTVGQWVIQNNAFWIKKMFKDISDGMRRLIEQSEKIWFEKCDADGKTGAKSETEEWTNGTRNGETERNEGSTECAVTSQRKSSKM